MNIIECIINDCCLLNNLKNNFNGNNEDIFLYLPLLKRKDLLIKIYENNYDFSNDELLFLLEDLRYLMSKNYIEILIIMKYYNNEYFIIISISIL